MDRRRAMRVREHQRFFLVPPVEEGSDTRTYVKSTAEERLKAGGSGQSSDTEVDVSEVHTVILHEEDSSC